MEKRIFLKKRPRSYANPAELDQLKRKREICCPHECITSVNDMHTRQSHLDLSCGHEKQQQQQPEEEQKHTEEFHLQSEEFSDTSSYPSLSEIAEPHQHEPQQIEGFFQPPQILHGFTHNPPPNEYSSEYSESLFTDSYRSSGYLTDSCGSFNYVQYEVSTAINSLVSDSDKRAAFSCNDISEEPQLSSNNDSTLMRSENVYEQKRDEVKSEKSNGWFKTFMGKFRGQK